MKNHTSHTARLRAPLPTEVTFLATFTRVLADRFRDDRGEIGIIGAIILVVGFAVLAVALVTAITGKLQSWISQIPT